MRGDDSSVVGRVAGRLSRASPRGELADFAATVAEALPFALAATIAALALPVILRGEPNTPLLAGVFSVVPFADVVAVVIVVVVVLLPMMVVVVVVCG